MAIADTVLLNGKVATVDRNFSFKEAVAVKNGWIIDVGSTDEIRKYVGPHTKQIDLGGKVLLPAAYDSHAHAYSYGKSCLTLDLGEDKVKTLDEALAKLKAEVEKHAPGEWVVGQGINLEALEAASFSERRRITCKDLDTVSPNNPVMLNFWSMHGLICNSMAMELAHVTKDTPDPTGGGCIERFEDGSPNGVFLETESMFLIYAAAPKTTPEQIEAGIMHFQKILNAEGYTGFTESTCEMTPGSDGDMAIRCYPRLLEDGRLTNRVSVGIICGPPPLQNAEFQARMLDEWDRPPEVDKNWLKYPLVKIFCDGVHLARTAWMLDDYVGHPGEHGGCVIPGDTEEEQARQLQGMIFEAHKRGYQVGVHAIGNKAVQVVIEGYIKAMQEYPREHLRHYVIHADSLASEEQGKLAARFGIPFSVQPGMQNMMFEPSVEIVGEELGSRVFGLADHIANGVICCGGADAIHGDYTHWRSAVSQAMLRKSAITGKLYRPDLAITLEQGIRLFTTNAAYQEHAETTRGSIEVGKVADFQVLDGDIFNMEPEAIADVKVEMTMAGGKVVYEKPMA